MHNRAGLRRLEFRRKRTATTQPKDEQTTRMAPRAPRALPRQSFAPQEDPVHIMLDVFQFNPLRHDRASPLADFFPLPAIPQALRVFGANPF
jgi:hypothetical protein